MVKDEQQTGEEKNSEGGGKMNRTCWSTERERDRESKR